MKIITGFATSHNLQLSKNSPASRVLLITPLMIKTDELKAARGDSDGTEKPPRLRRSALVHSYPARV